MSAASASYQSRTSRASGLIVDLPHPAGRSVSDGVSPELCSLTYALIDQAVSIILRLGRFAELTKIDVSSAYRIMPVHPEDRPLLGMRWKGDLEVEGGPVRGCCPTIRASVHCASRRPPLDPPAKRGVRLHPLPGRLLVCWGP